MIRPEMEHTSAGPETLSDETCVLTSDEWYALEDVVLWAMVVHKVDAVEAEACDQPHRAADAWAHAARAAAALAMVRGAKERTFQSHYPLAYPSGLAVG